MKDPSSLYTLIDFNDVEIDVDGVEHERKPNGGEQAGLGEWDAGEDNEPIPPRGWLLGNVFCREFVSSLIAEGGTGKTALRCAQLLSLATGRSLTGEHVFQRCKALIISLEDGRDELRRKIESACLHHNIDRDELRGWLYLAAPGKSCGKIMVLDAKGQPAASELAAKVEKTIIGRHIDIVSLDPFVKTHSVEENNNSLIDEVVQVLSDMAAKHHIAVDVPHHVSKGPADPGNANRGRGASAMKDGARLVYTLTAMSPEEARAFGLSEAARRFLARMDSAKVNIAPPMTEAKWFRLVSVPLGNATDLYPNGDNVQTVEPWTPPDVWRDFGVPTIHKVLDEIQAGLADGNRYTDAPKAEERAAWRVVSNHCPNKAEAQCREIIKTWLKNGLLTKEKYENPLTRKAVDGLWVDNAKRPS